MVSGGAYPVLHAGKADIYNLGKVIKLALFRADYSISNITDVYIRGLGVRWRHVIVCTQCLIRGFLSWGGNTS